MVCDEFYYKFLRCHRLLRTASVSPVPQRITGGYIMTKPEEPPEAVTYSDSRHDNSL
jgi:hypothetical protein